MNYNEFAPLLGSWGESLRPHIEGAEFDALYAELKSLRPRGRKICPLGQNVYRSFLETPKEEVKVVFVLQSPYPRLQLVNKVWVPMADGIAMSCSLASKPQPSLDLFYEGIEEDLYKGLNLEMEKFLDLKYLCNQGIMMFNSALTCEADKADSHNDLWKPFMRYLFEEVFGKMPNGIIFVLCGKRSQEVEKWINPLQHYIIKREHPAYAARQMRRWDTQGLFREINYLLKQNHNFEPQWLYEEAPF